MIEFVLLFALGFLAAALVALIVAPVIQRRIVSLTERRIRASVPLSVAEIRAEKDMARASYAAENARLSVDLKHNRDQLTESIARGTRLSNELVAVRAAKISAENAVEEHENSIRDLTAALADRDDRITTLTGNFSDATRLAEARKHEVAKRDDQINRLGAEIEELRIDLVTLDTEAENFKSQIRELRDERNSLREALKLAETTNRDIELKLKSNDARLAQSEEKLAKLITTLTDREHALDRRVAEVERYKQKNKELTEELRAARSGSKTAPLRTVEPVANVGQDPDPAGPTSAAISDTSVPGDDVVEAADGAKQAPDTKPDLRVVESVEKPAPAAALGNGGRDVPAPIQPAVSASAPVKPAETRSAPPKKNGASEEQKIDRLRARQAALVERLLKADKGKNDAALRREIATVAAMMVELTAGREGDESRIRGLLNGIDEPLLPGSNEPSLAARARDLLTANH